MRSVIVVVMFLLFAGCTDRTKVPKGIIPRNKMETVLWDMMQADRFVNNFIVTKKDSTIDKKREAAVFYERVFQLHRISRDEFIKSYNFYLSRPDITKTMFDSISARADRMRAEVHAPRKNNPLIQKRDSIMRRDSLRKADSIKKIEFKESTEGLSDSEMRKRMGIPNQK